MHTVIFDCRIFNSTDEKLDLVKDLLSRDKSLFRYFHTFTNEPINYVHNIIKSLPEVTFDNTEIEPILVKLKIHKINQEQEQFISSMQKYARFVPTNVDYIHESVFITEDLLFLEKRLPPVGKKFGLKTFFPNLILVDLDDAVGVAHYYEIKNNAYYLNNRWISIHTDWYNTQIITLLPELIKSSVIHEKNNSMNKIIRSLVFRFKKFIYALNCIGIEYYFETLKTDPLDSNRALEGYNRIVNGQVIYGELKGFIDPDNVLGFFYHIEYIISLVTGIFDNLAFLGYYYYNLKFDSNKISLSKPAGDDFLKEITIRNMDLRNYIDSYRNFINLIYGFREKVIHQEGLDQGVVGIVPNWNCFIKINKDSYSFIKACGDVRSKYKRITKWGLIQQRNGIMLDPFNFSSKVFDLSIKMVEGYVPLVK